MVPPSPPEISGRQNWANVGNLANFAQKTTKKQQMWKMMFYEIFENFRFLKIFDPQPIFFKNTPLLVEISVNLKNVKNDLIRSQRRLPYACAYFWTPISLFTEFWKKKLPKIWGVLVPPRQKFLSIGVFLGVWQKFLAHFLKDLH